MLTSQQLSDAFAHENLHTPSFAQLVTMNSVESSNGDAAAIQLIATEQNAPNHNSGLLEQIPEQVLQIIQEATGHVATYAQLSGWTAYVQGGGSLASMSDAFVASDMFANLYNGGVNVDPHSAPITAGVLTGIIEASHAGANSDGTPSQAQIDGWIGTGLAVDVVFSSFAIGDQYTTFVQPHAINYFEDVAFNYLVGSPAYPSGDLLTI